MRVRAAAVIILALLAGPGIPCALAGPPPVRGNPTDPVTGMEFVHVKGGCYRMGDASGEGDSDERPVHEVCVSDFLIGRYKVTQDQWVKLMGSNPPASGRGAATPSRTSRGTTSSVSSPA